MTIFAATTTQVLEVMQMPKTLRNMST